MVVSWKGWEGNKPEPGLSVEGVDEGGVLEGAQQLLHLRLHLLVAVIHHPTHHNLGCMGLALGLVSCWTDIRHDELTFILNGYSMKYFSSVL